VSDEDFYKNLSKISEEQNNDSQVQIFVDVFVERSPRTDEQFSPERASSLLYQLLNPAWLD
jgi:hypothetical protein